jgi:hypothetical protein
MVQNCFKILEFQKSFTTYKWVIMCMILKKNYVLNYNKIKKWKILIFGDDFKVWSFFKMKHWICKESIHF